MNRAPIRPLAALLLAAALLPTAALAQEPPPIPAPSDTIYEVGLADGSVIIGRFSEVEPQRVVIETVGGGTLEIDRDQIRSVRAAAGQVVGGQYWHPDPAATRLYFTATGRTLDPGQAYAGTYMIILPFGAVGVTDRIMVYGGAPVTLGRLQPFYAGAKMQVYRTESVQASVGTLAFVFEGDAAGIAYGVGTFGDHRRALSAGIGYFYSGSEVVNKPAFMVGGETRVSRRLKIISENYVLPDAVGILFSGGIRIIGDRFSAEIGLFGGAVVGAVVGEDGGADGGAASCCFPLVNFNYSFGR